MDKDEFIGQVVKLLGDTLHARTLPEALPELFIGCAPLQKLFNDLIAIRSFVLAVANGDLSQTLPIKGYLGGALKTLQAHLAHLTWQTKMIASGDFSQRVDFMGEFSCAFNSMVERLEETVKKFTEKEAELSLLNKELRKEIEVRKITEDALRQSEERYRLLSLTDPLTELYNRRHFFHLAEQEVLRACRYHRPLSVIMLDVDFFKAVNDTYGHACGDKVLQSVARTARQSLRSVDVPARYGGEEFVFLLPETDADGGLAIAERLRRQVELTPIEAEEGSIAITGSFGVSAFEEMNELKETPDREIEILIDQADQALYAAKSAGRNRVCIFGRDVCGRKKAGSSSSE